MEAQYNSADETETLPKPSHSDGNASRAAIDRDNVIDDGGHAAPEITTPPKLAPTSPRKALLFVGAILLVLAVAAVAAVLSRTHESRVLADETAQDSIPTVAVVHPIAEKPNEELVLPGTLQAYIDSPIYARTNGFFSPRVRRPPPRQWCSPITTSLRTLWPWRHIIASDPECGCCCVLPLHHVNGLEPPASAALASGSHVVISRGFDGWRFWTMVRTHGIHVISLVPNLLSLLADRPGLRGNRRAATAACRVGGSSLVGRHRSASGSGWAYGSSKGTGSRRSQRLRAADLSDQDYQHWMLGGPTSIGPALPGHAVEVHDGQGVAPGGRRDRYSRPRRRRRLPAQRPGHRRGLRRRLVPHRRPGLLLHPR